MNEESKPIYTLLDKTNNHLVFVEWETKQWFVCDVHEGEADWLEVGKSYEYKFGEGNKVNS